MLSTVPSNTAAAATATTASAGSTSAQASAALPTAQEFLQILLAEVKNQDPTSPADPTQYLGEMTGFAELQQLSEINSELSSLQSAGNPLQSAAGLLGRQVSASGSSVGVSQGKATSIVFTPAVAGKYQAVVMDSTGKQVDSVSITPGAANTPYTFTWQPPSGTADGVYSVAIIGSGGQAVSGLTEQGAVQSIQVVNGTTVLELGGGLAIPMTSVTSIGV